MKIRDSRVNGWSQAHLLPPEHLRIALTVHVAAASTSAQVGVEVTDHGESITLGIWTAQTELGEDGAVVAELVRDLLVSALREHHSPF